MLLVLATSLTLESLRRNQSNIQQNFSSVQHLKPEKRKHIEVVREDAIQRERAGFRQGEDGQEEEEGKMELSAEDVEQLHHLQETLRMRLESKREEHQHRQNHNEEKDMYRNGNANKLAIRSIHDVVKMKQSAKLKVTLAQQEKEQAEKEQEKDDDTIQTTHSLQQQRQKEQISSTEAPTVVAAHPKLPMTIPPVLRTNLVSLPKKSNLPFHKEETNGEPTTSHVVVPFFWHVLKSGGTTVSEICSRCFNLVRASGGNSTTTNDKSDNQTESLEVITIDNGVKLVNVDMATTEGIQRAKKLNLIPSALADILITPYLYESSSLFNTYEQKGQLFALFRHPIQRAVSMFHYLQHATWEPTYSPNLKDMTIEDYAMSESVEEDWMVRTLTNKMKDMETGLTEQDLDLAKEILRTKCVVGLTDQMEQSVDRFVQVFGWKKDVNETEGGGGGGEGAVDAQQCKDELLQSGGVNKFHHPTEVEGSMAWELLKLKNVWDIQLYEYAVRLFEEQAILFQ
eukprot:CAMPEP_0185736008 /NCGR_PEP_ID=MMETSP1171-20130828/26660_1 /TAXON_ID=374046 /ORGANISM="Helicotheca tamensis, Strain CCMP826" /LENGTH=511 /DNA_ID=CAMNT_0028406487 /DNA_START=217 /DNA_END=1752 /DNA_ORIENTATION=-